MYNKKPLTILLDKTGPHTDTHTQTKKWTPPGLYSAFQARKIVRLGVRMAGYLAASARLDVHTFPELQSPKARTRAAELRGGETRWSPLMRWSIARCNVQTTHLRCAGCSPPQTQTEALLSTTTHWLWMPGWKCLN